MAFLSSFFLSESDFVLLLIFPFGRSILQCARKFSRFSSATTRSFEFQISKLEYMFERNF